MFSDSINNGKPRPDYSGSDEYGVRLILYGKVRDARFLTFLEKVRKETQVLFSASDLLIIDMLYRGEKIPKNLIERLHELKEEGIVESTGRGRGTRYVLSRRFYTHLGKKATYTRKRGLDKATNKALLLRHIEYSKSEGAPMRELLEVLPDLTRDQVKKLLAELKTEGKAHPVGRTRAARWFPGSSSD